MGRQDEEREAARAEARERRRAYYESLSPQEKKEYRERVIRARKLKKLRKMVIQGAAILLLVLIALIGVLAQKGCDKGSSSTDKKQQQEKIDTTPGQPAAEGTKKAPEWVIEELIRVHEDTRPGDALTKVTGIVLHATGQPGVSAESIRSEIDKVDKGEDADPVSHFIIGIDGTVIQCIPLGEISYAAGTDHTDVISIQCCHIDDSGKYSKATQEALIKLVNWLMDAYDLDAENAVMRHHDMGGADCPAYYVEHPEAWNLLVAEWGGTPVEIPEETPEETLEETMEETSEEDTEEEESEE